ncbi:Mitochondrial uncoupling protein 2 [Platanthera guangdongensis]|uniref:Mitochondrial uncoupling protein 2 n=1 Tax=Platanthera guangdongensis TaxID=2320717 RepID=A0ABR2LSH2_9ASPA
MADLAAGSEISFLGGFTSSAMAACFAEGEHHYLSAKKRNRHGRGHAHAPNRTYDHVTRVQTPPVERPLPPPGPPPSGMFGTIVTIAKEEGLAALWKGIIPGLHRQCVYGGLRIGLYEPVWKTLRHVPVCQEVCDLPPGRPRVRDKLQVTRHATTTQDAQSNKHQTAQQGRQACPSSGSGLQQWE